MPARQPCLCLPMLLFVQSLGPLVSHYLYRFGWSNSTSSFWNPQAASSVPRVQYSAAIPSIRPRRAESSAARYLSLRMRMRYRARLGAEIRSWMLNRSGCPILPRHSPFAARRGTETRQADYRVSGSFVGAFYCGRPGASRNHNALGSRYFTGSRPHLDQYRHGVLPIRMQSAALCEAAIRSWGKPPGCWLLGSSNHHPAQKAHFGVGAQAAPESASYDQLQISPLLSESAIRSRGRPTQLQLADNEQRIRVRAPTLRSYRRSPITMAGWHIRTLCDMRKCFLGVRPLRTRAGTRAQLDIVLETVELSVYIWELSRNQEHQLESREPRLDSTRSWALNTAQSAQRRHSACLLFSTWVLSKANCIANLITLFGNGHHGDSSPTGLAGSPIHELARAHAEASVRSWSVQTQLDIWNVGATFNFRLRKIWGCRGDLAAGVPPSPCRPIDVRTRGSGSPHYECRGTTFGSQILSQSAEWFAFSKCMGSARPGARRSGIRTSASEILPQQSQPQLQCSSGTCHFCVTLQTHHFTAVPRCRPKYGHDSCPHLNAKNNVESYDPARFPSIIINDPLPWAPLAKYTVYGPVSARIMSGSSFKLSSALASPKPKLEVNCGLALARAVDALPLGYSEDLTAIDHYAQVLEYN
ncbi:hypothetical protein FIBSPDRAFT_893972 [Athelia psychrophila]|uniref:Uncharacterized protein n=1 Tax=Athelia psychrophila TaxID=1759441 RepID=A0A166GJS3_9AGAM|nr:hypothetical protein FIBSPDRAFT_893972 [Fibularhizoctonia sp. CBS 109695]